MSSTLTGAPRSITPRILARLAEPLDPRSADVLLAGEPAKTVGVATEPRRPSSEGAAEGAGGWSRPRWIVPVVAAALALLVGFVVVANDGAGEPGPGEALVEVDGLAIVTRVDGATEQVADRTRLEPGDTMVMERGAAELELNDDVSFSARSAEGDTPGTDLLMGTIPRLRNGAMLVRAPRATSLAVTDGSVGIDGGSIVAVTEKLATTVSVYRGDAALASVGTSRDVPALRDAEAVAPGELSAPSPLDYVDADPWDRRYLAPAIALDGQLDPLRAGLEASEADVTELAERLRRRLGQPVSAADTADLIEARGGTADDVIGLAIIANSADGSFTERWTRAFDFHDAGAPWGLVAMDLAADPDAVVSALAMAIDESPLPSAAPEVTASSSTTAPAPTTTAAPETGTTPVPITPAPTDATGDGGASTAPGDGATPRLPAPPGPSTGGSPTGGGGVSAPNGRGGVTVAPSGPVTEPFGPVTAPRGPITAPRGPVTEPLGPITAPRGPVTEPLGPITAPRGPVTEPLGPVSGPVLGPDGPLDPVTGPVVGPDGPLGPVTGPIVGPGGLLGGGSASPTTPPITGPLVGEGGLAPLGG